MWIMIEQKPIFFWMALLLLLVPFSLKKAPTGPEDCKVHADIAMHSKNRKNNSNPSSVIHNNNNNNNSNSNSNSNSNNPQLIPPLIHLTYVSPGIQGHNQPPYPKEVQTNIEAWTNLHPTWQVKVWNNSVVREEFPNLVPFFEELEPMAWVSDLLRILIVQKYGGFYFDTDIMPLRAIDRIQQSNITAWAVCEVPFSGNVPAEEAATPPSSLIMARDECRRICNAVIAAVPHHPVLANMADESLRRTARAIKRNQTFSVWWSGPPLWSRKAMAHNVAVFPGSTFFPCASDLSQCGPTELVNNPNVYGYHNWTASWLPPGKEKRRRKKHVEDIVTASS